MESKHQDMIEALVAELLSVYMKYLKKSDDEYDYVSVVLGALIFKELTELEYKRTVERDSEDDPEDICKLMREKASEMANQMRDRSLAKTMN